MPTEFLQMVASGVRRTIRRRTGGPAFLAICAAASLIASGSQAQEVVGDSPTVVIDEISTVVTALPTGELSDRRLSVRGRVLLDPSAISVSVQSATLESALDASGAELIEPLGPAWADRRRSVRFPDPSSQVSESSIPFRVDVALARAPARIAVLRGVVSLVVSHRTVEATLPAVPSDSYSDLTPGLWARVRSMTPTRGGHSLVIDHRIINTERRGWDTEREPVLMECLALDPSGLVISRGSPSGFPTGQNPTGTTTLTIPSGMTVHSILLYVATEFERVESPFEFRDFVLAR